MTIKIFIAQVPSYIASRETEEAGEASRFGDQIAISMGHLSSMFSGLAKLSIKKGRNSGRCEGREAAEAMAKDAKRNDLILCSSGSVNVDGSNNFASVFSKRGQKGVNQDCCVVWEVCS